MVESHSLTTAHVRRMAESPDPLGWVSYGASRGSGGGSRHFVTAQTDSLGPV